MISAIAPSISAFPMLRSELPSAPVTAVSEPANATGTTQKPRPATQMETTQAIDPAAQLAETERFAVLHMSPTDRLRALALERQGLTEDMLARLPLQARARMEARIGEEIEQAFGLAEDDEAPSDLRISAGHAYSRTQNLV